MKQSLVPLGSLPGRPALGHPTVPVVREARRLCFTVPRRPLELIHCEYHKSRADALRREGYFNTSPGKEALKLMLREALP